MYLCKSVKSVGLKKTICGVMKKKALSRMVCPGQYFP